MQRQGGAEQPAEVWPGLTCPPFPCSGNVERSESLHDNSLTLTVPLVHEVDTSVTG